MMRIFAIALSALLALAAFTGCSGGAAKEAEIALITDVGDIDDISFNRGAWEGVVKYAEEKGLTKQFYQPEDRSGEACLACVEQAAKGGAKVIVAPGYLFEASGYAAQEQYPGIAFILIYGNLNDGDLEKPTRAINANVVGLTYAEEQAGFLAGYAAVKEGMTKLGYMGGAPVPALTRYGFGFVQGAEYAAQEMGLADGSIELKYSSRDGFAASPEAQDRAAAWYADGTEVIFAAGGALADSVMAAAGEAGTKVIGADVDRSGASDTVITSAMKSLSISVYDTIQAYYDGSFPGGQCLLFDAADNGVSLAMDTSKFLVFTKADYDALFAALQNNTNNIASNILRDVDENGGAVALRDLPTKAVTVREIH